MVLTSSCWWNSSSVIQSLGKNLCAGSGGTLRKNGWGRDGYMYLNILYWYVSNWTSSLSLIFNFCKCFNFLLEYLFLKFRMTFKFLTRDILSCRYTKLYEMIPKNKLIHTQCTLFCLVPGLAPHPWLGCTCSPFSCIEFNLSFCLGSVLCCRVGHSDINL